MNAWCHLPTIIKRRKVLQTAGLATLFVAFITTLFFTVPTEAATGVNQNLNFQARLLNNSGGVVPDGYYNIQFKIYQDGNGLQPNNTGGSPAGELKWTETYVNNGGTGGVLVKNGYLSVTLGSKTPFGNAIDWNQDTLWLSMNIAGDETECADFDLCSPDGEMLPMKRLTATPFALNAARLGGFEADDFMQKTDTLQTGSLWLSEAVRSNTALQAPVIDTATAGNLTIGGTNATSITMADDVTVAAGKSLTLAGGNTASRPVSPTEGMLYYDTTTKQLLVYASGKWQSDSKNSTKIVAASNSPQAAKDGADFVADGEASVGIGTIDGDQIQINQAIAALPGSGGSIYLAEGTYYIDDSIVLPSNVKLSGAGDASVITVNNSLGSGRQFIVNSDTVNGNTGIIVEHLKIDGNRSSNGSNPMTGIRFTGVGSGTGSSAVTGAVITNTKFVGIGSRSIDLQSSNNTTISNNVFIWTNSVAVMATSGVNIRVVNNSFSSALQAIEFDDVDYSMIADNNIDGSNTSNGAVGLIGGSSDNTISNNIFKSNNDISLRIATSRNNIITSNLFTDNGGSGAINVVSISGNSDNNTISRNTFRDTVGTGNAIHIGSSSAENTYLDGNSLSGPGASTIQDNGTGTIYGGQTDGFGNYIIQPATAIGLRGNVAIEDGFLAFKDTTSSTAVALFMGTQTANYSLTIPTLTGDDTICTVNLANCGGGGSGANTSLSNLSSTNINTALNATNNDLTLQTTTSGNINISPAGSINLNSDVTVAAGKSLRLVGGNTASRPASPTEGMLYFDTDTKQLLVYANGKWQGESKTATKIVAASNSSQAAKDGADYVADGTGDQTEINAALTAATGGKIYLMEGTYTVDSQITVPNGTTLAGNGYGTLVQLATLPADTSINLIAVGNYSVVQDIRFDGNAAAQTGTSVQNGLQGSSDTNVIVRNNWFTNFRTNGAMIVNAASVHATITGNRFDSIGTSAIDNAGNYSVITNNIISNSGRGIILTGTNNSTVTGNTVTGSSSSGGSIDVYASNNITVTGNTIDNHSTASGGITVNASDNVTVGSNVVTNTTAYGLHVWSSTNTTLTGNTVRDSGGSTANSGIFIHSSDDTIVTSNSVTDSSATGTNYAIYIYDSASDNTYLADNTLGSGSINDLGTNTVYGGQANGSGNYVIQPAGTIELQKNANVAGSLSASTAVLAPTIDRATSGTLTIGGTNATAITMGNASSNTAMTLQGTSVFKPTTGNDSTSAFQIQRANGTAMFTADSTNQTITFGDPASGNRTVISTATGQITKYGTARNVKQIRLAAEYTGSVLDAGTGSNNTGTMTSSVDLTNRMNYYRWVSSQASAQTYDIVVQIPIPQDFSAWTDSTPLSLSSRTSNTSDGAINFELRDSSGNVQCDFVSLATNTAWVTHTPNCLSGVYTPGDYLTMRIRMSSKDNSSVDVGNIVLNYLSKY